MKEDLVVLDEVEGVPLNKNGKRAVHCQIWDREQITRKTKDIKDIGELQFCHFLPIYHRTELNSANSLNRAVSKANWDVIRCHIVHPMAIECHMGQGTCICVPRGEMSVWR